MLYRADDQATRLAVLRLLELAERHEQANTQRALIAQLGQSRRLRALRPLAWVWACSLQLERQAKRRWFRAGTASDGAAQLSQSALEAVAALWRDADARQYNQLDQDLRAGGLWSGSPAAAWWWRLSPAAGLEAVPEGDPHRVGALGLLSCHPTGQVREAALRHLVGCPLPLSLPFILLRANDWVQAVRAVAYARLLDLDAADAGQLAPWLELVEQLAAQGRREPGAVEHLLNVLRSAEGLGAVRACWRAGSSTLRRSALRLSWESGESQTQVICAAATSKDPVLRRWCIRLLDDVEIDEAGAILRRLVCDRASVVSEAALDALDAQLVPGDRALLETLRCAASARVQLTARFMLERRFGVADHKQVYLHLLRSGTTQHQLAAAVGLSDTGSAEDCSDLLKARLQASPRARRRLLRAAVTLDAGACRSAMFEDLGHGLRGVSDGARRLLVARVSDADAASIVAKLGDSQAHVRRNALLLGARLSHWRALPLLLGACGDGDTTNASLARQTIDTWLATHFYGIYRPPGPSVAQAAAVREALEASAGLVPATVVGEIARALADG